MIVSPKKLLWPTDFSALSLKAGSYARGFHELFGGELHVIHVIVPPIAPDVAMIDAAAVPLAINEQDLLRTAHEMLDRIVKEQLAGCDGVRSHALIGNPWQTICGYAKDNQIDLIVLPTHGRTGLSHVLIGSTAERVVQHAPCPVLVVKGVEREFLVGK